MSELENEKMKALNETDLNNVSGGAVNYAGDWAGDKKRPWEVLDENGEVLRRFGNRSEAENYARQHNYSTTYYDYRNSAGDRNDIERARSGKVNLR